MSSHSEKLLELELELRSLRGLRDEVENLRGTLESVRTRLTTLEQGGRGGSGSTHTLGESARTHAHSCCRCLPAPAARGLILESLCSCSFPRSSDEQAR